MLHTNVREVHIAVDHVGHHIAHLSPPQFIGRDDSCLEVHAARLTQPQPVLPGDFFIIQSPAEDIAHRRVNSVQKRHSAPSAMPVWSLDAIGRSVAGRNLL